MPDMAIGNAPLHSKQPWSQHMHAALEDTGAAENISMASIMGNQPWQLTLLCPILRSVLLTLIERPEH